MRIFVLLFVFLFSGLIAQAQCVPDTSITHNDPGIYPDTITNLPHAHPGIAYQTTIQFKILADTFYMGFNVPIDSVNILSVGPLPPSFNYLCTPSSCSFPGGSDACVLLTGNPTTGTIGTYPLVVQVKAYGTLLGTPVNLTSNITGYKIVIDTTTAINNIEPLAFSVGQNSPNPVHELTNIPVTVTKNVSVALTVTNLIGKKVFQQNYSLQRGKNTINLDLHDLPPGIYLYSLTDGKNNVTRRMIVSND